MSEEVVLDSTCLIALERIGRLDLLPVVFGPVLAPPAVRGEFGDALSWFMIVEPQDQALVRALHLTLGLGEAEALALASERGLRLITDDLKARKVAAHLGVQVSGTIGILLRAKRNGVLTAVMPVIAELENAGFFLSNALKAEAKRISHE